MTDQSPEDVTHVTRNSRHVGWGDELKLLVDIVSFAGMMYWITHPDAIDKLKDNCHGWWQMFIHRVSVWTARQDIRTLPETDEPE